MTPPQKHKTLYVSDLDGTLLDKDSKLSQRSAELINQAIDKGALFTVATARTPATVSALLEDLRLPLPAIVMTGAALWHQDTETYDGISYIDAETARKTAEVFCRNELPFFMYTLKDDMIHIYHHGPMSEIERNFAEERVGNRFKQLHLNVCTTDGLPEQFDNTILFYSMQPGDAPGRVYAGLESNGMTNNLYYHDIFGPDVWILEVFALPSTKANAISKLAAGIEADRVVVFGDNVNDLTMMRRADVAVAVGNAIEQVKNEADIVIEPNHTDAVARWILQDITGDVNTSLS